jgi:hypothetical protein
MVALKPPPLESTAMIVPISETVHYADPNGLHLIYRFPNNRGVSVIRFYGSLGYDKGLWELAEIKFNSEDNNDWELKDDVIGFLTWKEVTEWLEIIMNQPAGEY